MSDINIELLKGPVSVKLAAVTPQVAAYSITVYDTEGTTELKHYFGDSLSNNPYGVILINPVGFYLSRYVATNIAIANPVRAGNSYFVVISLEQGGVTLSPSIQISGTT